MKTQDFIRQVPFLAWVLMLATLAFGLFGNFLGSLTPELSSDLNLSPKDIGHLMMAVSTGGAVGAFLGGDIAHRFRAAPLMLTYFGIIALSVLGIVFAPTFFWICACYFVYSVTSTAVFTLAHSIMTMLNLGSELRPRLLALIDVGFSVGATLSPLWVTLFLVAFDEWRAPIALFFIPLCVIVLLLTRPQSRATLANLTPASDPMDVPVSTTAEAASVTQKISASYLDLIRAPWAKWAWICGVLIGFVEWGQTYWFVIYASTDRGLIANTARVALAAFTGGMLSVRIWQAFFHSHVSNERRLKWLGVLGSVMFMALALMPKQMDAWLVYVVNYLGGVGIGVVFPLLLSQLIDRAPESTSKLSALLMLTILLGLQCAGVVVGYLSTHVNVHVGYAMIALAMVGFTAGVWRLFARQSSR
ncbi:hypothetical protein DTO96_100588 [Ephemeroptericola cinctiostellae]|uniref:Major facilitator superfamily (MFS) profile domain-containing protein n=1 Tax=Ephemeroptericola cinctiostellae TaxID=2268024 RepID=A0A345D939_9BURK|nr:MFS transporter [Ephemeroptericola cinctiostellae]AXF84877.1 hypothetical protein DTO96_100588 [Ephemeroptericola cinctiostellae]